MKEMRPPVGRPDLFRAYEVLGEPGMRRLADFLGLREEPAGVENPEKREGKPDLEPSQEAGAAPGSAIRLDPVPFWRLEQVEFRDWDAPKPSLPAGKTPTGVDLRADPKARLPAAPPVAPWPVLWAALSDALQAMAVGREIDLDAAVERLARVELLEPMPRRELSAGVSELIVLLDRSVRLMPVWPDEDALLLALDRRLGVGLRVVPVRDGDLPPPLARLLVRHGRPILAITDLGFYSGGRSAESWQGLGFRLRRAGVPFRALVPCPSNRWDRQMAALWQAIDWSRPMMAARADEEAPTEGELAERSERLLSLVSPAVRVEPGLLRTIRCLLPVAEGDLGTEIDAWSHPDVDGTSPVAFAFVGTKAESYRQQLVQAEHEELRIVVAESIMAWHGVLPRDLQFQEKQTLLDGAVVPEGERAAAEVSDVAAFYAGIARLLASAGGGEASALTKSLERYMLRALKLMAVPAAGSQTRDAIVHCWAELRRQHSALEIPVSLAADVQAILGTSIDPKTWQVGQRGRSLELRQGDSPDWKQEGSWVASLDISLGGLDIAHDDLAARPASLGSSRGQTALGTTKTVTLISRGQTLHIRRYQKPKWAAATGRDRFGLWAMLDVKGVHYRLRWLPPGRFRMGSPDDEAGRIDREGPAHEVVLTAGFWLGEKPVTQDLWQTLVEKNPSRFESLRRPVERVSWEECKDFTQRLDEHYRDLGMPDFGARLPSEAEWEYACRAGTLEGTYAGDLEILGKNNAPLLDDIAWYGGNSGVGFELENGSDSSEWSEKQLPHERAGTRIVGMKKANPWGLHDMLGNVYEWCEDAWSYGQGYEAGPRIDPVGHEGPARVVRGGSWDSVARYVRAAYRHGHVPGLRIQFVGFRLARGQGGTGLDRTVEGGPAAVRARRGTSPRTRAPRPTGRTEWASRVEHDSFGWWATFELDGVEHRMRWIQPGAFLMGSPETEAGRFEDEGPQHEVKLPRGFWLGETPCTQDLWQVVAGENPSQFQSPRRPVEQVSWEECQHFLGNLNERLEGLGARLPSEAEWEYACRAGTRESTYAGDLEILGQRNAPLLDDIAWYGGSSGDGFELENGSDSSEWPEKQFPHERAGTRIVGTRKANPWGLHDMLGNVFEWCEDAWAIGQGYEDGPRLDPVGHEGPARVIRGGSWDSDARLVRAASRFGNGPGYRYVGVGFRLARGQE